METDYTTPFVQSTRDMLEAMLGMPSRVITADASFDSEHLVVGSVHLEGERKGGVRLVFPVEAASRIVAEMLGMGMDEMDDDTMKDGVGEMANIVAGNVKAQLSESHFTFQLTLPVVEFLAEAPAAIGASERRRIETELGFFDLIFWLG